MMIQFIHFGNGYPLGMVNARVSAEIIGGEAGDRIIKGVFSAEKLYAHDGAGDRRVGGAGEYGNEPEPCQEVDGSACNRCDSIAQRRADKEQGSHFPAFETGTQCNGREQ